MFRNQFVACLKVGGQILREDTETVRLPFGSEYTLFLRNYDSRRAVVKVEIDGQDALGGRQLVVNGNSFIELERFIKDGDLSKGNRFRFIHKDEKIQQHRGDRVDDGMVRVSWQYEQLSLRIKTVEHHHHHHYDYWPGRDIIWYGGTTTTSGASASGDSLTFTTSYNASSVPVTLTAVNASVPVAAPVTRAAVPQADEGITVAGSESRQSFGTASIGMLEPEVHVITLKLLGESPLTGQVVEKPVTVREKLECETCGTKSDSKHRFCGYCGTCLGD